MTYPEDHPSRLPKARQYNLNVSLFIGISQISKSLTEPEEEGPRRCASFTLLGCENSEVRL